MAEEKDDSGLLTKLGSNGLIWLLLAAFGTVMLQNAPLLVQHPASRGDLRTGVAGDAARDARLWQDPFGIPASPAAIPPLRVGDLPAGSAIGLAATVQAHPGGSVVLAVSVPAGSFAESIERRRRMRVAVIQGLMAEGLVAENAEQLMLAGSVPYEWFVPGSADAHAGRDSAAAASSPSVLVAWISEASLGRQPRDALCAALSDLSVAGYGRSIRPLAQARNAPAAGPVAAPDGGVRVAVLGPGDSQGLLWTLADPGGHCPARPAAIPGTQGASVAPGGGSGPPDDPPGPHFFTAMATIALPAPPPARGAGAPPPHAAADANSGLAGSGITRLIASDRQVARTLVDELSLRSVNPFRQDELAWTLREVVRGHRDPSDDAVALVTEADTPYGRAMREAFCKGFRSEAATGAPSSPRCADEAESRRGLFTFSYLRGLNGELPRTGRRSGRDEATDARAGTGASAGQEAGGGDAGNSASAPGNSVERAEGNAQTDYLERLADRLSDLDHDLQADRTNPRALRAIGLLGTDVYDKLMLLRALKPRFPGTVFFTTDLDARLLDNAELRFTRNLVIASSYGLALADDEGGDAPAGSRPLDQHGFPPFRDAYQTATFLATRVAVRVPDGRLSAPQAACLRHWTGHVHVYEVGRDSLAELRPRHGNEGEPGEKACRTAGWSDPQPEVTPASPPLSARQRAGLALTFLAMFFTFLQWAYPPARKGLERLATRHPGLGQLAPLLWGLFGTAALASMVVAAALAWAWPWLADVLSSHGEGQPFLLVSGLSVWPALVLVALASAYWLSVLLRISGRLRENLHELHDWLGIATPFDTLMDRLRAEASHESRWHRWARHMFPPSLLPPPSAQGVPPFWRGYLRGGLGTARAFRWGVLGGMMIAVFCVLNDPLGNHLPLRGQYVEFTYTALNNIALGFLMFLMVAVADASLFCTDFLDHFDDSDSAWPDEVLEKVRVTRGMDLAVALPWLRVEVAARRTAIITPLIYHPFWFMAVLIVSHSTLFSPWRISLQQMVVVGATAAAMLFCSLKLRRSAEDVRDDSLECLSIELQRLQKLGETHAGDREQVRTVMRAVAADRRGALAPFAEQPLIRSLILPLLSLAGTSAAEIAALWQ